VTVTQLPTAADWRICPEGCVTAMAIVQRAGITYRQLDYWTRTGLLHTVARPAYATSGTDRHYPLDQLHRAATLRWLLDAGISLQTCRAVIDDLLTTGSARLTDGLTIHLPEDL
jgi:DNA-binding transcriptional MerR regulator